MRVSYFVNRLLATVCLCGAFLSVSADHGSMYYQGVNYLQSSSVSLNSFTSMQSLRRIKKNGANTIAIIAFMQQPTSTSSIVRVSSAVTDNQLIQAIVDAQDIGLRVILKPQILVEGSWAGEINPGSNAWGQWFDHYQPLILHYAEIAARFKVSTLVIGTELRHASNHPRFRKLIVEVRKKYKGEITYAAHGVKGVESFPYWDMLDSVSVTLYPSLGKDWNVEYMSQVMQREIRGLKKITETMNKPVWVAEIGISSTQGSFRHPWLFGQKLQGLPDEKMQAKVLDLWLQHLDQPWVDGVLIWNWFSDIDHGGVADTGFTIQNKSAEKVASCYWNNQCTDLSSRRGNKD